MKEETGMPEERAEEVIEEMREDAASGDDCPPSLLGKYAVRLTAALERERAAIRNVAEARKIVEGR